jgi:hypothetical protein
LVFARSCWRSQAALHVDSSSLLALVETGEDDIQHAGQEFQQVAHARLPYPHQRTRGFSVAAAAPGRGEVRGTPPRAAALGRTSLGRRARTRARIERPPSTSRSASRSKRKKEHLSLPFALTAAINEKEKFVDRLTYRNRLGDSPHSWHRQTGPHPIVSISRHCLHVLRQDDSACLRRPLQEGRILRSGQPDILHAHKIDLWTAAPQAPSDVSVEVLVSQEGRQSLYLSGCRRASSRSRMPACGERASNWRRTSAASSCCWRR